MLSPIQLSLTKLIGKKEPTKGCYVYHWHTYSQDEDYKPEKQVGILGEPDLGQRWKHLEGGNQVEYCETIGHPATLSDFHRWLQNNKKIWEQRDIDIKIFEENILISYDSSRDLLSQEESTLEAIKELIIKNK